MDLDRLVLAHRIATPEQRITLEKLISSMVNLILENYEECRSEASRSITKKDENQEKSKNQKGNSKLIQLTQIENSSNYYDVEGFVYSPNNSNNSKHSYFRCKYASKYKCYARVIVSNDDFKHACLTKKHQHLAFKRDLLKSKLDKKMHKVCNTEKFLTTREAYCKATESLGKVDMEYIPDRKSYGPFVHRIKKQFEPKIPHSFEEFDYFLDDEKYRETYTLDSRKQTFYRGTLRTNNGDSMILFISETGLKILKEETHIEFMMDGTFKILPRHIKFAQLFIISFIYEDRSYPLAFVFMEKRDLESYDLLFVKLKSLFTHNMTPRVVKCMVDYEKAIRKVLQKHFPNARISGCWFHYIKAVNKAARKFGLSKDQKFEKIIQEVCHIALLPNDFISEGFDNIDAKATESTRWSRFSSYWKRQWQNANISVYGLKHRTDNFSESLNHSLNLLSGRPHQDIWSVLRTLKTMEKIKSDELLQHKDGRMFETNSGNCMIEINKQILNATLKFEETQDVDRFLKNVSYRSETVITVDEDEEGDCDEGFFDYFIPNNFEESCNFVRNDAEHRYVDFFKRNDINLKRNATKDNEEM